MNLRSRLLSLGCFFLLFQFALLYGLYYYTISPQIKALETAQVQKNLHRIMQLIQRELYNLEHLSQVLVELPLITHITQSPIGTKAPDALLQQTMMQQNINFLAVLNNKKVVWEKMIDLNTENTYPTNTILPMLWAYEPSFFSHTSAQSQHAGIYNSAVGPMLMVSEAMMSGTPPKVEGTLMVGKLITYEMMQLLQSLSFTDTKLWPLDGAELTPKHREMLQHLSMSDTGILIETSDKLFRGYMALPDLNEKSPILLSTAVSRDWNEAFKTSLMEIVGVWLLAQCLFLGCLSLCIRLYILSPIKKLIRYIRSPKNTLNIPHWNEMTILAQTLSQFMHKQQTLKDQETTLAYRKGVRQAHQDLLEGLEKTLTPLMKELEGIEQKLCNLPIHDIEWIIAQNKTGAISIEQQRDHTQQLEAINQKLRDFQKETRTCLYELHTQTLRNRATLRAQSRNTRPLTGVSNHQNHISSDIPV